MLKKTKGFTLVELSVSIVIIGLIAAAVLNASSFITAAKASRIMSEVEEWKSALNTFKFSYEALPGDFTHARRFFGNTCGGDDQIVTGIAFNAAEPNPQRCNGNNDGQLNFNSTEQLKFFQHLYLAGMYDIPFTGRKVVPADTTFEVDKIWDIGVNVLGSSYASNAAYIPVGKDMRLIALNNGTTNYHGDKLIEPRVAAAIDYKTDDGYTNTGTVRAMSSFSECIVNTTDYAILDESALCGMYFLFNRSQ